MFSKTLDNLFLSDVKIEVRNLKKLGFGATLMLPLDDLIRAKY